MTIHPAVRLTWDELQALPDDGKRRNCSKETSSCHLLRGPATRSSCPASGSP